MRMIFKVNTMGTRNSEEGSSSFSMDTMIFNSRPRWFYEDIYTKQRRVRKNWSIRKWSI